MTDFRLVVLCPSRGRPDLAAEMEASFPCPVYFYLNDDDPTLLDYKVTRRVVGPDAPIAYTTNFLSWQAGADAYMFCGDDAVNRSADIVEQVHAASCRKPHGIWAAGVNDGREDQSFPHFIVSDRWREALGYVVNPIFHHWRIDTWTERVAKKAGVWLDLSETVLVEHRTPKTGKTPVDDTFKRIRKGLWRERDAFVASFDRYMYADVEYLRGAIHTIWRRKSSV